MSSMLSLSLLFSFNFLLKIISKTVSPPNILKLFVNFAKEFFFFFFCSILAAPAWPVGQQQCLWRLARSPVRKEEKGEVKEEKGEVRIFCEKGEK